MMWFNNYIQAVIFAAKLLTAVECCIMLDASETAQSFTSHYFYDLWNYDNNEDTCWIIEAPRGYQVHAWSYDPLQLEGCYDTLDIYCGDSYASCFVNVKDTKNTELSVAAIVGIVIATIFALTVVSIVIACCISIAKRRDTVVHPIALGGTTAVAATGTSGRMITVQAPEYGANQAAQSMPASSRTAFLASQPQGVARGPGMLDEAPPRYTGPEYSPAYESTGINTPQALPNFCQ